LPLLEAKRITTSGRASKRLRTRLKSLESYQK
jgi:hypothetical protein